MTRPFTAVRRRLAAALGAAGLAVAVSACGLQPATGYVPPVAPGSIQPIAGADDVALTVGSKNFTEQLILGKIGVIALEAAGFEVTDATNIPGSVAAREALVSGDIDMMWEYTGTAWVVYLGEQGIPDQQAQWEAVRDADASVGITWLPPAPMNNTYGFAMGPEATAEFGISSLSEIADVPVEERTFCVDSEFRSRDDGFEPMLEHYGIPLGDPDGVDPDNVMVMDTGAIYAATAAGECNFGEIFNTDGRILALDLARLEDDAAYFPSYNGSANVSTEVITEFPEIADVFAQIAPLLTDEELMALNLQVDIDGREPVDVAMDWMVEQGLVTRPAA